MFILIASNNSHKVKEIDNFLKPLGIKTLKLDDLGIKENPQETGASFQENSLIKAKKFFELSGKKYPVLSDDSGLCVHILNGLPGVFSARYGGENLPSYEKNKKLLKEAKEALKLQNSEETIKANFVTHLCFYEGENRHISIEESLEGEIKDPSYSNINSEKKAFGYDPIFYPKEFKNKSLANLSTQEKNLISARGKALQKLFILLREYKPTTIE